MAMLIALLPALFWGATGIVTTKMGGTATQGTLGMTFGAFVFGILTTILYVIPHAGMGFAFNPRIWVVGFFSGLFWAVGSAGQFTSFKKVGVSIGNPISTAGQIITNALMAAIVLQEWTTPAIWIVGSVAIILVTVGAVFTSVQDKNDRENHIPRAQFISGMNAIVVSTLGFMMYFVFPNLLSKIGYISSSVHSIPNNTGLYYMTAIILPQSIGQMLGAFLIIIFVAKQPQLMFKAGTWRNMVTGLVWAIGNVFMFISAANPHVGQAVATTLSQLGVVVATLGGIFILHEHKTRYQMKYIIVGIILLAIGGVMMGDLTNLSKML